jgi:hypothetical protein
MFSKSGEFTYSETVTAFVKGGIFTVEAFPNPLTSNELTVRVLGTIAANATIHLTDMTGKLIRSYIVKDQETKIDMSAVAQGMYLIKYVDDAHSQAIKINRQ